MKFFDCPHCWRVVKSKSALTRHINEYHYDLEEGWSDEEKNPEKEVTVGN